VKHVELSTVKLDDLIRRFAQSRIAVIGDFFLDKYLDVDPQLAEPSVETGKTAHQVTDVRCSPGAAGTVVCNLAALGAGQLHAIGFTGDDGDGFDLRKELARLGCAMDHLHVVPSRRTPTYLKPRDANVKSLAGEHSRYDTKNRTTTAPAIEDAIVASLDALLTEVDAVIVLDQVEQPNCGAVTDTVRRALSQRALQFGNVVFWADSRRRIHAFCHLVIKPNQFEVVGIENPLPEDEAEDADLLSAARLLREKNRAPVVVTRGSRGMLVSDPDWTVVPGVRVDGQIDPTGAGDSATAGTVLALCSGADLAQAALVGNLVASITIQQIATTGVAQTSQLADRLAVWQEQQS